MKAKCKKFIVPPSIYQEIADKYGTSRGYVGEINRGLRNPVKGKGLKIKQELEKYNLKSKI